MNGRVCEKKIEKESFSAANALLLFLKIYLIKISRVRYNVWLESENWAEFPEFAKLNLR